MRSARVYALTVVALLVSAAVVAQDEYYQAAPRRTALFDDYGDSKFELMLGYVNKSWVCTYDFGTQREDFFGDPNTRFLHGFQIGGLYTPAFDWGLGLRTGLYLEFYTSQSKWITWFCNGFEELDLYVPVQASYRYSITEDFGFQLFGGFGFQLAMDGRYYKYIGTAYPTYRPIGWYWYRPPRAVYATEKQEYGNGWPKRVNWQAEIGASFHYKMVALSFTYSFGLNDHGIQNTFDGSTYVTAKKSRQDKMQASIAILF